jgi:type IV secretion system protein VirB10
MSGYVSRGSVRRKQLLLTGIGLVALFGAGALGVKLLAKPPSDAPIETRAPAATVSRRPPKQEPQAPVQEAKLQVEPAVVQPQPPRNREPAEAEMLTSSVSRDYAGDSPPRQSGSLGGYGPPPGERPGEVGRVTFKPFQLQGAEAGVAQDLTHTIKPTTRALLTLDQALDSSLPGPLVAHFDQDVLSWDRSTVLVPKDTPVLGSYQQMQTGQRRLGAMSAHAFLANGQIIPLGAPFTDDLGRMGIPGYVDTRWMERFGNAILVDAAFALIRLPGQALTTREPGQTNINLDFSSTQQAVSQILNSTLNLPPLLKKNQGEQVMIVFTQPIHVPEVRMVLR